MAVAPARATGHGPFAPGADAAYRAWRDAKLAAYPASVDELLVPVRDPRALSPAEHAALARACARANMAIYAGADTGADRDLPRLLARQFGLVRLDHNWLADDDGISSVTVAGGAGRGEYIPYTNKPIRWHTDGYYNPPARRIQAMVLHCVRPGATGGENALMDHEVAYILVRDADPALAAALMRPDAMTIPERTDDDGVARPAETGPVFSVDPETGALHMRYTARTRSIEWNADPAVRAAAECLARVLAGTSPYIHRVTLQPGMGLLCNNVLHDRTAFTDDPARPRLIYRARYHDRIRTEP
ncbi:MAG: TauD/TfdA family dioxygenase [Burkholderiales bacterium]